MTQAERDRLVALKKAKNKLITQKQAAEELVITQGHVRRLLRQLKRRGDNVVLTRPSTTAIPKEPFMLTMETEKSKIPGLKVQPCAAGAAPARKGTTKKAVTRRRK